MQEITTLHNQLLDSGVHFGHLRRKWNPKMLPYIFSERKGIHIIDLNKTIEHLHECASALKSIAKSGRKILFVATKTQVKQVVTECALRLEMPYVTQRWLGGTLTNFSTIKKSIKKMNQIDKMLNDGSLDNITKKERLQMSRSKENMEKILGGITDLNRTPSAVLLVDIGHEKIALNEAKKLNLTTFGLVDTNCNPDQVDFFVPCNDDSTKSVAFIVNYLSQAIEEGLEERKKMKTQEKEEGSQAVEDDEKEKKASRLEILAEKEEEIKRIKTPKKKTPLKSTQKPSEPKQPKNEKTDEQSKVEAKSDKSKEEHKEEITNKGSEQKQAEPSEVQEKIGQPPQSEQPKAKTKETAKKDDKGEAASHDSSQEAKPE